MESILKGFFSTKQKLVILLCLLSFFSVGCSYKRKIAFSPIEQQKLDQKTITEVQVQNVNFEFNTEGTGDSTFPDLQADFQNRLIEKLMEKNIKGLVEDNGPYKLNGKFAVTEDGSFNGLIAVSLPLAALCGFSIVGFPLVFAVMAIPTQTYDHSCIADIVLTDTRNNVVVLEKQYKKEYSQSYNDYTGVPQKPDSTVNQNLSILIDDTLEEIAEDIVLVKNKTG